MGTFGKIKIFKGSHLGIFFSKSPLPKILKMLKNCSIGVPNQLPSRISKCIYFVSFWHLRTGVCTSYLSLLNYFFEKCTILITTSTLGLGADDTRKNADDTRTTSQRHVTREFLMKFFSRSFEFLSRSFSRFSRP